jgi:flagellar M-ring protein FliF
VAPAAGATASGSSSERVSETVNYEISKVVSRHILPTGRIQRLSVAVLVDGKPVKPGAEAEGVDSEVEGVGARFTPWSASELEEFEELAKRAVGFSSERGDEISVINAPFMEIDAEDGGGVGLTPDLLVLLTSLLHGVAFLIGLVMFSKFFIRPLAAAVGGSDNAAIDDLRAELSERLAQVESEPGVALGSEELAGGGGKSFSDMEIPGLMTENDEMTLQQQVDRLAQLRSEDSVRTIRGWMAAGG